MKATINLANTFHLGIAVKSDSALSCMRLQVASGAVVGSDPGRRGVCNWCIFINLMAYNAFISHSHTADGTLAAALQSALDSFAKHWYKLRALHLFRSQTNLAVNPAL